MSMIDRRPERDVAPADWVVAGVSGFRANRVTSLVPAGFAAYARVLHPAAAADGSAVRWGTVARANRRIAHRAMDWVTITGDWRFHHGDQQPGVWEQEPEEGSLPAREAAVLAGVLAAFTASRTWWYAVWEGFGDFPQRWRSVPTVSMPARPMYLFRGTQAEASASFAREPLTQSASLWWPDDRAWCVATDVDLMSTYLGARRDAIAAVVGRPELEAYEVPPEQTLAWNTDALNPLPPLP